LATPRRVESKAVGCDPADVELVRLLAVLAKASFTYQETNRRTQEACSGFLTALLARTRQTGMAFVLEVRSDRLCTTTGTVPAEPLRDWLRTTLQRALLGAIRIEGTVAAAELAKFLARLRSTTVGKIRKDATFQFLWPEPFAGLQLRELRFFGGYHADELGADDEAGAFSSATAADSSETRTALGRLGLQDVQLRRILSIERRLASQQTEPGAGEPLSLSKEVLAALPADVVDDPVERPLFVDRLLDRFEALLDSPRPAPNVGPANLGVLVELFRKLPPDFFRADDAPGTPPASAPPASKPHRPEDDSVDLEDPALIEPLVAALPASTATLEPDPAALQAESLRVCMYQLGADTAPAVASAAAAKARKLMAQAGPESRAVLEHYVRQALVRGAGLPAPSVADKAMLRLQEHDLLPELRRLGVLTVERIVRFFPNGFVPFLRSLSEGSAPDAEVLVRTLKSLSDAALDAGVKQLILREGSLDAALVRKLLRMGGRSALGVARILLSVKSPALQEEIVAWLRELAGAHAEAVPLACLDAGNLPPSYLEDLCEFERTGKPNPRLRSQAGGLLYAFIEAMPNDGTEPARKARAIAGLAAFPGPSSEALLKQALRGEGLLGPLSVPALIREAVRAVRARWKDGSHV
jgi:hypothetical protein